ncbi:MAG TPA: chromate resistance protein ChrB domain-containing protein, partial [Candidatus Brocadiales bacterium]|nr:chromate resistance protein ChrB domain-containing protein [Candidatus Brocadiales bacterium]
KERYLNKKWITRARPHVDRIASAWLIKKFIDMDAEFAFASKENPVNNGIPFDMVGVELTHHGEDCTFETIVKRFGIKDRAVREIAEIVHEIDLKDGKYERHESRGIDSILRGLLNVYKDDQELLKAGFVVFEALYSSIRKTKTQKV